MIESQRDVARDTGKVTYDAFISYSHAADGKLAPALENALEGFAKPWYRRRALHLFRDQTSLSATPGLWPSIEAALNSSRFFLLLASPEAAASRWVQQEVAWWLEHKAPQTMLIGLTDGHIKREEGAKDFDWERTDALPPNLKGVFVENPLWVDFRWAKGQEHLSTKNPEFQNALAALAAPLRNVPKEDLVGEDARHHRRALLLARGAALVLVLLVVAALTAAVFAFAKRFDAERQGTIALTRLLAGQSARAVESRDDERAALLARQAYLASQQSDESTLGRVESTLFGQGARSRVLAEVDRSLRSALSVPYFSRVLAGHTDEVDDLEFSSDGSILVSSSSDWTVRVWDLTHPGAAPVVLKVDSGPVDSVSISPDGRRLAAPNGDGTALLWNLTDLAAPPGVLGGVDEGIGAVAFSPDGEKLATGSDDGRVALWDVDRAADPVRLEGHDGGVTRVAFGPDGRTLASADSNGMVRVWDLDDPSGEPVVLGGAERWFSSVAFSPDGMTLVADGSNGRVRLWNLDDLAAPPEVLTVDIPRVSSMVFSPDGQTLAGGGDDGLVRLWDRRALANPPVTLLGDLNAVIAVAFSPDGQTLATAGGDMTVRLWHLGEPAGAPVVLARHEVGIRSVAVSPNGRTIASVGDEAVRLAQLDEPGSQPIAHGEGAEDRFEDWFSAVAFGPDGRRLAASRADGAILLWDLDRPEAEPARLPEHTEWASAVTFSPDGRTLATGSFDQTVRLWDLTDVDAEPAVLSLAGEAVRELVFSPDGQTLAVASLEMEGRAVRDMRGKVRLWNLADRSAEPILLAERDGIVDALAFSPDGRTLAADNGDGSVTLWELEAQTHDGKGTSVILGPRQGGISDLAFSPDGKTLAVGIRTFDRVGVRLSDLTEPNAEPVILETPVGSGQITSVAFSRDGAFLVTGSEDGAVRRWDLRQRVLAALVCGQAWRNLSMEEWRQFVGFDFPYQATCPNLPPGEGVATALATPE